MPIVIGMGIACIILFLTLFIVNLQQKEQNKILESILRKKYPDGPKLYDDLLIAIENADIEEVQYLYEKLNILKDELERQMLLKG